MRLTRWAVALPLLIQGAPTLSGPVEPLADFLGPHGCAIGPPTLALAEEADHAGEAIDALIAKAAADPRTVRTGEWIVLPPGLCRITVPDVRSKIRLDDPDIQVITSRIDAYAKDGLRGCFLFGPTLMDVVRRTRGWDEHQAYREWVWFAAQHLRTGDLAFYGTDPANPPPGFLVLTGDCANIPQIDAIRRSQSLRDREFDALIRANASDVVCGQGRTVSPRAGEIIRAHLGRENGNQWMAVEIAAMGAIVGQLSNGQVAQEGALRPPFCHFD